MTHLVDEYNRIETMCYDLLQGFDLEQSNVPNRCQKASANEELSWIGLFHWTLAGIGTKPHLSQCFGGEWK